MPISTNLNTKIRKWIKGNIFIVVNKLTSKPEVEWMGKCQKLQKKNVN
jgi:hypothetical protein